MSSIVEKSIELIETSFSREETYQYSENISSRSGLGIKTKSCHPWGESAVLYSAPDTSIKLTQKNDYHRKTVGL